MQSKDDSDTPKHKRWRWVRWGCGAVVVVTAFAVFGISEGIRYHITAPYIHELSLPNTEHRVYAYAGGFQDISAEYIVDYNDRRFTLSSVAGKEYVSATLCVSVDGQIVATKTDLNHCRERGDGPGSSVENSHAMYTHAFDFTTGAHVEMPDPCASSGAARKTRHAEILGLLNKHGGEGKNYRPTWPPGTDPTMRKMGYWEWKRWQRRSR